MRRRNFIASLSATAAVHSQPQRQPNILTLMYDKCRADAIGCYSGAEDRTPNLNKLARSGIRFDHAYTPQALCAPARALMLTGLYPHAHGVTRNVYPEVARVPLIMRYPARIPQGKVWHSGVNLAALAPTILEAANVSLARGLPGYDPTLCRPSHEPVPNGVRN
jgi:arylsulfatase A-like enzyme